MADNPEGATPTKKGGESFSVLAVGAFLFALAACIRSLDREWPEPVPELPLKDFQKDFLAVLDDHLADYAAKPESYPAALHEICVLCEMFQRTLEDDFLKLFDPRDGRPDH